MSATFWRTWYLLGDTNIDTFDLQRTLLQLK